MKVNQKTNALEWAKFFVRMKDKNNWTCEEIDEALMTGYFANCLMAQYDALMPTIDRLTAETERLKQENKYLQFNYSQTGTSHTKESIELGKWKNNAETFDNESAERLSRIMELEHDNKKLREEALQLREALIIAKDIINRYANNNKKIAGYSNIEDALIGTPRTAALSKVLEAAKIQADLHTRDHHSGEICHTCDCDLCQAVKNVGL